MVFIFGLTVVQVVFFYWPLKLILCESLPKQLHLSLNGFIYHPIKHIQRQTTPISDPLSCKCSKRADKAGLKGTIHP